MILNTTRSNFGEKFEVLQDVYLLSKIVFNGNEARAGHWIESSNMHFDGESPLQLCLAGNGNVVIEALMDTLSFVIVARKNEAEEGW